MVVEEIGMGKGHSSVDVRYYWQFRLELSEGSSRFVELKKKVIFKIFNGRWRGVPTYHWRLHEIVNG